MKKIFAEDFYWQPTVLMATESVQGVTITLHSQINYIKDELTYVVSESSNGGILYWNFNILGDAVDCYNKRLMIKGDYYWLD